MFESRRQMPPKRCLALVLACATLALAACGGQDGGNNTNPPAAATPAPPPPPPEQAPLAISAFTPASGPTGTEITVSGTGLDTVSAASVGTATAAFRVVSATEVRVTVPAGAASGRVGVQAGSRAAASASDFVVVNPAAVPTVASITPTTVTAGGQLTLTGTGLDQVASARLAAVGLPIASQSATQLRFTVPAQAVSGALTLVDRGGTARTLPQTITVQAALAIASFSPSTVARGQTLNITGQGLDRASGVRFAGNAEAAVASRTGSTALTVTVPAAATSGPFTVLAGTAEQATSATALTVYEPIAVNVQVHNVAVGASVTLSGTGLAQVLGVKVANADAVIGAQSATSLTFAVPAGISCGAITLRSAAEPTVPAGSVVVGPGCNVRAAGIEFAQVLSQGTDDRYQRLAAGKETWVRGYVVSSTAATPAPVVRATGLDAAGQTLGTITLVGPATLPTLAAGAALPDSMRYDESLSFNAELPAAWVQPGLRVRVVAGDAPSVLASSEAAPLVAASGGLRVVLVPLVSGSNSPVMAAAADVARELARKLPVVAGAVNVSVRAPYTLTSVTTGVIDQAQWSSALAELERLRDIEAPNALYYGMVKPLVTSGIAGIGYVNSIGSRSPALSALGWDASRSSWPRTLVHELGHNFSRPHAPCGSVAGADPNYPYANGVLGPTPLFDSVANDVLNPGGLTDIMGYCRGEWFSDYNLDGIKRFLEARPAAMMDASAAAAPAAQAQEVQHEVQWLVIAGTIDADGVTLAPPRTLRASASWGGAPGASAAPASGHRLSITLADGRVLEQRIEPVPLDHASGVSHFIVRLPHPGRVSAMQVSQGARAIATRTAAKAANAGGAPGQAAAAAGPSAEVARQGGAWWLRWNAAAWPHASLMLALPSGERHALAIDASGGAWRIAAEALSALPPGGRLEVSLSDGTTSELLVLPRP
jgi:hypothetical protein